MYTNARLLYIGQRGRSITPALVEGSASTVKYLLE